MLRQPFHQSTKSKATIAMLIVLVLAGCTLDCPECPKPETHPSRYSCNWTTDDAWECDKDGTRFECNYIKGEPVSLPEPICVPEWCSLPLQDCSLNPMTGGVDSCGNQCIKPSKEFPNCLENGTKVIHGDYR